VLDQPRERSSSLSGSDARRGGGGRPHRAPSAPRDPFFDKPYEPGAPADATPAWEASAKAAPARGVSSNIKSKRKVAALFKSAEPS
jgi:hypothetical protein